MNDINFGDINCRHCFKPMAANEATITISYWGGVKFVCHKECKQPGERADALECQTIDADCNDCRHFVRGNLVKKLLSCIENGRPSMKLVNFNYFEGRCSKFDRETYAQPNKWRGMECFEHRRSC